MDSTTVLRLPATAPGTEVPERNGTSHEAALLTEVLLVKGTEADGLKDPAASQLEN